MRFQTLSEGIVDTQTGLLWKGHSDTKQLTYEASLALQSDLWRLPTVDELAGLVDRSLGYPASDFPLPDLFYWTGSSVVGLKERGLDAVWIVDFKHGTVYYIDPKLMAYVLLVRRESGAAGDL